MPGTTLPACSAAFRWSYADGDNEFWLVVRRSDGSLISSINTASEHYTTVYGLPMDGTAITATLFSLGEAGWAESSAMYTAASAP